MRVKYFYYMTMKFKLNLWILLYKRVFKSLPQSIPIHDSSIKKFKPSKGFRHVNPLTPFIFLTLIKGLVELIRQVMVKNLLKG